MYCVFVNWTKFDVEPVAALSELVSVEVRNLKVGEAMLRDGLPQKMYTLKSLRRKPESGRLCRYLVAAGLAQCGVIVPAISKWLEDSVSVLPNADGGWIVYMYICMH